MITVLHGGGVSRDWVFNARPLTCYIFLTPDDQIPANVEGGYNSLNSMNIVNSVNCKQAVYPARALRALGLLLADVAPTVGRGKTF